MLKWILITSITLVSTTLLMFVAAYIAVFTQTAVYYSTTVSNVILLSNTFNIFYLIVSPLLFPWLKKHFSIIVKIATLFVAIGCVGRYLAKTNYNISLVMSILVAISHVPIITAPYGLLGLFEPKHRGYASSIPLFVPALGINFCIFYGLIFISQQFPVKSEKLDYYINNLNLIIALVAVVSCLLTQILMTKLKKQIRQANEDSQQAKQRRSCVQQIKSQFTGDYKPFIMTVLGWATILGMNWTYGGMFGIFLDGTQLTHKQVAFVGLCANLSSAIFCNLGNWISNRFKFSNISIIFYLNAIGFIGALFVQASSTLPYDIFHNIYAIILAIIMLRAGFSSFVSLALIQLNNYGPSVLVSSIFFWIANATNLIGIYFVDLMQSAKSLAIISSLIWVAMFLVHLSQRSKKPLPAGSIQVYSEQYMGSKKSQASQQFQGSEIKN